MFSKLRGWFLDKQTNKLKENKNTILAELNDELRETKKEYADALKEAQQMQKIIESRRRIEALKRQTQGLERQFDGSDDEEEEEDDEEEEDEELDFSDRLAKQVLDVFAKRAAQGSQPSTAALPSQNASPVRVKASNKIANLTEEQLAILDKKGFFD